MEAIKTAEVKQKLCDLQGFEDIYTKFGKYLSTRLNEELVPMGFVVAYTLAVSDLQKGVDGYTGLPISGTVHGKLLGYPAAIYNLILAQLPAIAEASCPPDFAAEVKAFYEDVR